MFDRFTDRARKVMNLAKQAAQELDHDYIGTEHILIGLIQSDPGVSTNVLKNMGVDLEKLKSEINRNIERGSMPIQSSQIPFTPLAKRALELSMEEASKFKHNYIGTEHLLLGLLSESEGLAARILVEMNVHLNEAKKEVCEFLGAEVNEEENEDPNIHMSDVLPLLRSLIDVIPKNALTQDLKDKEFLTSREVASICNVTIRTVLKWMGSGELEGIKIPGSRERKTTKKKLIEFMEKHGIPKEQLFPEVKDRILLADSSEEILFVLEKFFDSFSTIDAETAFTGTETKAKLDSFQPHLLILGHPLKDISSLEFLHSIANNPSLGDLKIIFNTEQLNEEEYENLKKEGMDRLMRKPFTLVEFNRRLSE